VSDRAPGDTAAWPYTTESVIDSQYDSLYRKKFLRGLWFPIVVTVVLIVAPSIPDGFSEGAWTQAAFGLLYGLVLVAFHWTFVVRDVRYLKYSAAATKLDEVLQSQDGRWDWCEKSEGYAVHFGDDPHDEDTDPDEAGDTEK
jgi:hypothetical protein